MYRDQAGKQSGFPVPPKLNVPQLLAGQKPNHASYACSSASNRAAHGLSFHTSSSVLLENQESRGDGSTHGPPTLPAQGRELADVGPHQPPAVHREVPLVLLQASRKAHYWAHTEDFYTNNFTSLISALNTIIRPTTSWPVGLKQWRLELRSLRLCISSQRADHSYAQTVIYPVVPELLCGCHMSLCEVTCHIIVMVTCHHITAQLSWTHS